MGRYLLVSAACAVLFVVAEIAQLCLCANSSIPSPPCVERERQALLEFKASVSYDPSNWLSSWQGLHCCQWEGIGCDNLTGRVVMLDLSTPYMKCVRSWRLGEGYECYDLYYNNQYLEAANVNPSLQQLEYLTYLDLTGNDFSDSPIPVFIGSMQRLMYLSLSDANFGGRIPNNLGNLTNLHFLDLSRNYGLETNEINWISGLRSLEHLDMSFVYFGNNTHKLLQQVDLTNAPQLQVLGLAHTGLTVSDLHALQNMTSLVHLDLSWNRNLTSVPSWFANFEKLQYLDLSGCGLHGPIPDALTNATSIESLYLSSNEFDSVPYWFHKFEKLKHLDLSSNGFRGPIPDAFINTTSIESLYLSRNKFDSVPSWFHKFEKLKHLDLSSNGFRGPIPDAFINTTSIESLYLFGNEFDSVPSWFHKFEKLKHLDLSSNGFRGPIPDVMRNIASIEFLDLSSNLFTSVPSWFVELKTLLLLDLSRNELTSMECPISSILRNLCHLKSLDFSGNKLQEESIGHNDLSACIRYDLEILDLGDNIFSTSLPSWMGQLENLKGLYLQENLFYGLIPFSFRKLSKLKSLYLSNNKLVGDLPNIIGQLVNLLDLDLSNNYFSSIPQNLGQLVNLKFLYLSNNSFSSIPQNLGQLINLKFLDLSNNYFNDTIIKSLGQLVNLRSLDLSNNHFNGTIFHSLSQLVNLRSLYLSSNHFNGSIPQSLGQLVHLENLNLSNNHFNGPIPQGFGQLVNLSSLDLSRNKLHGSIPIEFGQLVNLDNLNLSSNNLDGTITPGKTWSWVMPYLQYLDLSNNQIRSSLPKNIGHMMPNLQQLLLKDNLINGSIPNSLCQLELFSLDLSKNRLVGEIPNCWKDNPEWGEINLSFNKLSGVFPTSFGNLSTLSWLHLNNNSLQGELPACVKNLTQLLILDLGENKLSGNIPSWTANTFPSLQILRLRQNMLGGSIPPQLCQLPSLKILDISRNNLQGSIPSCIGRLRGMTLNKSSDKYTKKSSIAEPPGHEWSTEDVKQVMKGMELDYTKNLVLVVNMDLSENKLAGVIPEGITLLNGLHGLNLSNNHLKGGIPKMIGDMKSLESFDVSNNQLSGTIPNSMSALTSLSHLNLSHNNFSGPIPTDHQFSTYDSSSYADNPYLCGLPLPNKCPGDNSSHQVPIDRGFEDEDGKTSKVEKWLFYFIVAAGFATGFWGVIGVLLFKKSWRHAYFRWVEDVADRIYVATAINLAKLKKRVVSNSSIAHG